MKRSVDTAAEIKEGIQVTWYWEQWQVFVQKIGL